MLRSATNTSEAALSSPAIRLSALEVKARNRPSAESAGWVQSASGCVPPNPTLTRRTGPEPARTKISLTRLGVPATRLVAWEANATSCPSPLIDGEVEVALPEAPVGAPEINVAAPVRKSNR